ncbi:NUDIX hydrolase [Pedobacter lusitanus]|uniref:hypothetical protein n=1 Tax=Pedobacter lusitanus TaxID=1503925 RepID=UPI000B304E22|nr:hypothetical protein [Pedobacter lusitanus]
MIENVKILNTEILSDNWYTLKKITYTYTLKDGSSQTQDREAYDRGNGATILLYNKEQQTVILTRQFRLPTYINGNSSGMLIELAPAYWTRTMLKIVSKEKPKKKQVIK